MRILFVTATRIGDAVLTTGLVDYLSHAFPEARFTIVCGPVAAGIFTHLPGRQETIILEKRPFDAHWLSLWSRVLWRQWDWVIDLRGSGLSLFLWTRRRSIMRGGRREGHRLRHVGAVLGLSEPPFPVVWTSTEDNALAAELMPKGPPIIGLGPTANWKGKVWPGDRFVAFFHRLREVIPGARPAVFGGPGPAEAVLTAPVLAALPEAIDLTGRLSLSQAAACLTRTSLFVGNDSGLMHLAAAAGSPTLGLFGPSRATEYAPAGRRTLALVAPGPTGCAAMGGLTVDIVAKAAQTLLFEHRDTPWPNILTC